MTNVDYIKANTDKPYIEGFQEEAFWHSKYSDEFHNFIMPLLTTAVEKVNCWPINRHIEEVMFDWIDILYCWWLEDEYDGWYEKEIKLGNYQEKNL